MRVAEPFPRLPNQAPKKAVRFGALRAPSGKCQLVPRLGDLQMSDHSRPDEEGTVN
jgi:hypothetical protein